MDTEGINDMQNLYCLAFDPIQLTSSPSPSDSVQPLLQLKQLLAYVLEKTVTRLHIATEEALNGSFTFLLNGLGKLVYAQKALLDAQALTLAESKDKASSESTISLYIQQGDELRHQANMDFSSAHNEAVKTMLSTANIEKKMIAAKIRILTTLHLNSFFDGSVKRSLNMPLIKDYIMQAWNEAINLNEVKTAISDEFEPSIFRNGVLMVWGDIKGRKNILYQVTCLRSLIGHSVMYWPAISNSKFEDVDISSVSAMTYEGHTDFVQTVIVSEGRLYTGSADNAIKIWDIVSYDSVLAKTSASETSSSAAISASPCLGTLFGHNNEVTCLAICRSDTRKLLCSGSKDHAIKVWDISNPDDIPTVPLATLQGHSFSVYALAVGPNQTLYSGSGDKTIKAWTLSPEVIPNTPIVTLTGHTDDVNALAVFDGHLYSGSWKSIRVWDIASSPAADTPVATLSGHKEWVTSLIVHNGRLYSASSDCIKIWNLSTGDAKISMNPIVTLSEEGHDVKTLAISAGRLFSGSGAQDTTIKIWDIVSEPIRPSPIGALSGLYQKGTIFSMAIANGRLFTGSNDEAIHIRNL